MIVYCSSNGRTPVSSKPPLPPQPPRAGALSGRISSTTSSSSRRRATTDLGNPAIIEMAKARTMQASQDRPVGLLETDLDAAEEGVVPAPSTNTSASKKTRSLLNLNHTTRPRGTGDLANENALHVPQSPVGAGHRTPSDASCVSNINQRPHKSMEFLLDKENLHFVKVRFFFVFFSCCLIFFSLHSKTIFRFFLHFERGNILHNFRLYNN